MSIINKVAQQELNNSQNKNRRAETNEDSNKIQVILQYSGKQSKKSIAKMKTHIRKTLPENKQTIMTYQSTELSTKFNVKVKAEFCYQNNLVYHGKCPNETCT